LERHVTGNEQIVEACRLAYTGFEKNQRDKLLTLMSPDIVLDFPTSLPYGGTFRGMDEFRSYWTNLYANYFETFNYDAHAVLDAGTHVIVPVTARAKAKNGRTMEIENCLLLKVENGRVVHVRIYADTARGRDILA